MKKLYMPEKIRLETQYFKGMGRKELKQWTLALIPGLGIGAAAYGLLPGPKVRMVLLLAVALYGFFSFALFVKLEGEVSVYTYLCNRLRFDRSQKIYLYKQEKEEIIREEAGSEGPDGPELHQRGGHTGQYPLDRG